MIIIVAPNHFNIHSNGHIICMNIWKKLILKLGESNVCIISGEESMGTVDYYRQHLGLSYLTEDEIRKTSRIMSNPYCLLLPDDLEGLKSEVINGLTTNKQCKRIYIMAFAPLFVFSQRYKEDPFADFTEQTRVIFFADWFMPQSVKKSGGISIYQEPVIPQFLEDILSNSIVESRKYITPTVAIYAGKGIYRLSQDNQQTFLTVLENINKLNGDIELITREKPKDKDDLYTLLANSQLLICLDPFSNIEREALILGCSVWKPNPGQIGKIPGIYYGSLPILHINNILNTSKSRRVRISESYRKYSELLQSSSETKIQLLIKAITSDMLSSAIGQEANMKWSDRLLINLTGEAKEEIKSLREIYSKCIHPMEIIPSLNNSLGINSAINLLKGRYDSVEENIYNYFLENEAN